MTIDALRRFLLPCFFPTSSANSTTTAVAGKPTLTGTATPKKRLSTSLRDDISCENPDERTHNQDQDSVRSSSTESNDGFVMATAMAPPRPSKSMVIGTIFGNRRGHVWFCVQNDRLSIKPVLLVELPIFTNQLVQEMRCGLVRIALECNRHEFESCPLRRVPVWTMNCSGRKLGFAAKRKASERVRSILKTMQCVTVGAGVLPSGFGLSSGSEELMYLRANYEHIVGNADSESFHLINPDECPGQELSIFLLRTTHGAPN